MRLRVEYETVNKDIGRVHFKRIPENDRELVGFGTYTVIYRHPLDWLRGITIERRMELHVKEHVKQLRKRENEKRFAELMPEEYWI